MGEYAVRQRVHEHDGWKCRYCKTRNNLHSHHIVFRSHGGSDTTQNEITLCSEHHDAVHSLHLVILPAVEGQAVDANAGVRFYVARLRGCDAETGCKPDPDYVCGAAYCDDPACGMHFKKEDTA